MFLRMESLPRLLNGCRANFDLYSTMAAYIGFAPAQEQHDNDCNLK